MKTIRRAALLGLALVLLAGACAPAFATYPSLTLHSKQSAVYRGHYLYHNYNVNSNSYGYQGWTHPSGFRAYIDMEIYRCSDNRRCMTLHSSEYSGKRIISRKTYIPKNWPKGLYKMKVRSWCCKFVSGIWNPDSVYKCNKKFWWYFTVR